MDRDLMPKPSERPVMSRSRLEESYSQVRGQTEILCEPLTQEDCLVQSMPEASPTKWHLAHTSWFFETFVLRPGLRGYSPANEAYLHLFNSYYNAIGEQRPRSQRSMLSRPSLSEVHEYRRHVDRGIATFLGEKADGAPELDRVVELGIHHEQQHQELILTDIKHAFGSNPLAPTYRRQAGESSPPADQSRRWIGYEQAGVAIGHDGDGFAFDNEQPRHMEYVHPYELCSRLVTCAEFLEFIEDGGYERSELWLSDGWAVKEREDWRAPLYWREGEGGWWIFTLAGLRKLDPSEPVCHVSYYEADAFARWAGVRLPTETEWERAAGGMPIAGNFIESGRFHPGSAHPPPNDQPTQLFGDVWEWTASAYLPYPGFRAAAGALGEYNGKFMVNQMVLRGGSCASPASHLRPSYRNFFPPDARWQFAGIRLAR